MSPMMALKNTGEMVRLVQVPHYPILSGVSTNFRFENMNSIGKNPQSQHACFFGTGCLVESSLTVTKKGLTDEVISRAVSMLSDFVICFDISVPLNV